jgi:nucleotide-binding universal stress UspA family protein
VDRIVVGVDGSDESKDALRWTLREAEAHGATVVAVHAWQVPVAPPDITAVPQLNLAELASELKEAAEALVAQVVDEVAGGADVNVEALTIEGSAAPSLIEASKDADLLVVGSRGLGGFRALLLGSVGQYCVTHAHSPVLVYRARPDSD